MRMAESSKLKERSSLSLAQLLVRTRLMSGRKHEKTWAQEQQQQQQPAGRQAGACDQEADGAAGAHEYAHVLPLCLPAAVSPTCLPLHNGRGLRMAGMGTLPSQSCTFIKTFIIRSASMKVSRCVMSLQPSSVSYNIL